MRLPLVVGRLAGSRLLRALFLLAVAEIVLGAFFSYATATRGLLSPAASPHVEVLLLGAVFLVARVLLLFLGPAVLVYVAVEEFLSR